MKKNWYYIVIIVLLVVIIWLLFGSPLPTGIKTDEDRFVEKYSTLMSDTKEEKTQEPPMTPQESEAETQVPPVIDSNPEVELILRYSDKEYSYISQRWEMSFGLVYGIELTGEGFERINEDASTAYFSVPDGYFAIIFTDGLGSNKGKAVFDNSEVIYFDKGNPTMVGESMIVPSDTDITIPFQGNDSSGVLVVLSADTHLLEEYIDFVK